MTIHCYLADGTIWPNPPRPMALLPGSFNPLHIGHRQLAAIVAGRWNCEVHFELSIANVDKPDLPAEEVERRVAQFRGLAPVWVTRAPTFAEKAHLFPGTAFIIGHDTAVRLFDVKYYGHDSGKRDDALAFLRERGCRFVVAGRVDSNGLFRKWEQVNEMLEVIDEREFRVDVSSTELRINSY